MFKTECNKFLDTITSMRTTAVNRAVEVAIANEHTPYVDRLTNAKEALIVEEKNKTAELIRTLQADLERKVDNINKETEIAIAENRKRVVEAATIKAQAEYDGFILGVSKLVDETKIN